MTKPLDRSFNAAVLHMAALKLPHGFDVSPTAPDTLESLKAYALKHNRLCVFDGASDNTIFGDPKVNHAFRAWHDWHHLQHSLPFTLAGEHRVYLYQCDDLRREYGVNTMTAKWLQYLEAEIDGQVRYALEHNGAFPVDQLAFVTAYLGNPAAAIAATF